MSPGEIEAEARAKFGEPNRHLSSRRELRFGRKGSVSVALHGERAGAWFDHEADEGGWLTSRDEKPYARPDPRRRGAMATDADRLRTLNRIVERSMSARGTPAEAYLRSRGITEWPDFSVRFCTSPHGALWLARDGGGGIRAAQIVYLTPSGEKDTRNPVAKRTIAAGNGWHETAAVRLPGRGETILCEGVETGLSVWLATGRTVLCGMGPAIFGGLVLTSKRVTFGEDGNEPFNAATYDLCDENRRRQAAGRLMVRSAERRAMQGIRVKRARPPVGLDFNDIHQASGLEAVADIIRAAK